MKLTFHSKEELVDFIGDLGYVKADALVASVKPTAKKKATAKKETPAPTPEPTPEPETPAVTVNDVVAYVQANFADNIQPVVDMLATIGAPKISEIPAEKLAEALGILKGE